MEAYRAFMLHSLIQSKLTAAGPLWQAKCQVCQPQLLTASYA